jgi:hypothetical protein
MNMAVNETGYEKLLCCVDGLDSRVTSAADSHYFPIADNDSLCAFKPIPSKIRAFVRAKLLSIGPGLLTQSFALSWAALAICSVKQALEGAKIDEMDARTAIRIIVELCC